MIEYLDFIKSLLWLTILRAKARASFSPYNVQTYYIINKSNCQ